MERLTLVVHTVQKGHQHLKERLANNNVYKTKRKKKRRKKLRAKTRFFPKQDFFPFSKPVGFGFGSVKWFEKAVLDGLFFFSLSHSHFPLPVDATGEEKFLFTFSFGVSTYFVIKWQS